MKYADIKEMSKAYNFIDKAGYPLTEMDKYGNWDIKCIGINTVILTAPRKACIEFMRDLKGTIENAIAREDIEPVNRIWITTETVANIMNMSTELAQAWLMSCVEHANLVREFHEYTFAWYLN